MAKVTAPKAAPRYILYTRVSTQAQKDNYSHPSQLAALEKHAAAKGGRVVAVFQETYSGGSYWGRTELQKALDLLEGDRADVFACFDFSRYTRDRDQQSDITQRIHSAGKRIDFCALHLEYDEDGELTPQSRLSLNLNSDIDDHHKYQIRLNTMRGARQAAENGFQSRRKSPYGYHVVTMEDKVQEKYAGHVPGQYVIVETEAAFIAEAFSRRALGEAMGDICDWMNEQGSRRAGGGLWNPSQLSKLMQNTVYKGKAHYGTKRRVTDHSRLQRGFRREFVYRKRPEANVVYWDIPRIVEPEIWDAVQALREMPKNRFPNANKEKLARFLLSSTLKCPRCKGPMIGTYRQMTASGKFGRSGKQKPKKRAPEPLFPKKFYTCKSAKVGRWAEEKCLGRIYPAADTEERVVRILQQLYEDPQFMNSLLRSSEQKELPAESGNLEKQLADLELRERTLIEAQIKAMQAARPVDTYETMLNEVATERRVIEARLQKIRGEGHKALGKAQEKQIRAQLEKLQTILYGALEPGTVEMQKLRSFLFIFVEAIEFEEPSPGLIGKLKLSLR